MPAACRAVRVVVCFAIATICVAHVASAKPDGNRLAYLDGNDPYYPHRDFAKLTTPQWVGEPGVEAVVILSVDDLRDTTPQPLSVGQYEAFLRPIFNRLKQIDGRAAVSVMTCQVDPKTPLLQTWLAEGVSLETHTFDHPCPLLHGGDFAKAKSTYDRCVDLLATVPGSTPVAFRMPCCDSLNTPSPRFFAEIFNKQTPGGRFLAIDSSVFNITTSKDPALPKEIATDADGKERFRKYVPFDSFVNTIEDYPYPYVIGRLCWEFPCATPSDWQAQHLHGPNNPKTVEDWKRQLDATVIKQGVMPVVFHPHGWISNSQIVEFVDYAAKTYGGRVKFLTFEEAKQRLEKNLTLGEPLRDGEGGDNDVRVVDVNGDGFMDVIANGVTRVWDDTSRAWKETPFPASTTVYRFGVLDANAPASVYAVGSVWEFDGGAWFQRREVLIHPGFCYRDIDGDGRCESILPTGEVSSGGHTLPFRMPAGTRLFDRNLNDAGARFVDVDDDGDLDLIFSDDQRYGFYRFADMKTGWEPVFVRRRDEPTGGGAVIPPIVSDGTNNGAWFHSKHLWVQNENTATLPNLVDRVSFAALLGAMAPAPAVKAGPAAKEDASPAPLSPEEALKSFKVYLDFKIELAAAEPVVTDPVAFNWAADGKLYVVEMGDYPLGVDGQGTPGGRVRVLEDADGDRRYEKSVVFLDKLPFPTGVTPYKQGAIVTAAPDIFYAEDTDGDGRADKREVLFTGFGEGNQQHRVNGLVFGLDNWFHGANGDSGGQIKSIKTGKVVDISGRDFRINVETGEIDPVAGVSQFGRARDDWGNWFGCNNSNPNFQIVLDDRYIRRNPHVAPPAMIRNVPEVPGAAPVFPVSKTLARFNDPHTLNHFTSACGLTFYRDELAGSGVRGSSFVSEPVHNLVHREVVWQDGVLVKSRRADEEGDSEFIASTDNWFRPTMLRTGPDGALWVADMYRLVIEHPKWIPQEWQERLDLRAGHDMGRLYRVYHSAKELRRIPNLAKMDSEMLVQSLESPGAWERDMAQQVLVERQDKSAVPHLEKLAATSSRALARLGAICALDGLGEVKPAVLIAALVDPQAGVRAHAVRIAETQLKTSPELAEAVLKRVKDPDPTVRMQIAYSLGEWDDPRAGESLGAIALRDAKDPYISAAVISSVNEKNLTAMIAAVTSDAKRAPSEKLLADLMLVAAGVKDNAAVVAVLEAIVNAKPGGKPDPAWQFKALAGALDGAERRKIAIASMDKLTPVFDAAREAAIDDAVAPELRAAAVALLGRGSADELAIDAELLGGLLTPQTPEALQSAAIERLARITDDGATKAMLAAWQGMTPALRVQTLDAFLQRQDRLPELLAAVEKRKVLTSDFDASRRRQLLEHADEAIRKRAEKVFAGSVNPDRQKVIDQFSAALTLTGDPEKGKAFFAAACATCHKVGDLGINVGPDLLSLADHSAQYYLLHVLDPNRAVEAKYTNYVVETRTGQMFAGVLSGETGNSVTVTGAGGKPETVLRADLKRLRATPLSAMPEGLETGKTPQDFADLFAFLAGNTPAAKPKAFPGNKPAPVKAAADTGVIRLLPSSAEIYGSTLVLEPQYGNLGWWSSADDRAAWTLESPRPGAYDVVLEWACADGNAGNTFALVAGSDAESRLIGKVEGTGVGWDDYRKAKVGRIELPPGATRIELRPEGRISGSLIDLKLIELVPGKD